MVKTKHILDKFSLGMELEIGVENTALPPALGEKGWDVTSDGSIDSRKARAVEYRSGVYRNVWDLRDDLYVLKDAVKFKDANRSMGIHIHIKPVNPVDYGTLYTENFTKYIVKRYKEEFAADKKALARLGNHYCESTYESGYFSRNSMTDNNRYKFVNITGAYARHKTIEFRCFYSTTSVHRMFKFIRFVVDATEEFIEENRNMKMEEVILEDGAEDVLELEV